MSKKKIALVTGDGSAPEMMAQAVKIAVEAAKKDGIEIEFVETPMGWNAYNKSGDTLPAESLEQTLKLGIIFFGGVGDPKYDNTIGAEKPALAPETRALTTLRSKMGLLLNFRPIVYYKSLAHLAKVKPEAIPDAGIQQIWIRMLLEDSYFGNKDFIPELPADTILKMGLKLKSEVKGDEELVGDFAYYRKSTLEKYFRAVFAYAKEADLPVISIDKSNIMARYVLWRKTAIKIWKEEFPEVKLTHQLVDSANSMLFTPAAFHSVIACGNEHGDILSDGAAAALGSMGMMSSSSINPDTKAALFESGAGTAPTLAGTDKANPIGRILTAALMLRHIGAFKGAEAIENSVNKMLREGYRTGDLLRTTDKDIKLIGTSETGKLILGNL
ncbi:MAG: hypothetical protein A2252_09445 [Elusimicrobia bacterium RIFOXYA2_FULL_39_19]|nr:MAG: hypothetical protein A2252_09445 [Elusimicrobia bacterium RIFOXYA2_FULL_39_19]